jgi:hypothetical protein
MILTGTSRVSATKPRRMCELSLTVLCVRPKAVFGGAIGRASENCNVHMYLYPVIIRTPIQGTLFTSAAVEKSPNETFNSLLVKICNTPTEKFCD